MNVVNPRRHTVHIAGRSVAPGEAVDLPATTAESLIAQGWTTPKPPKAKAPVNKEATDGVD